MTRLIGPLPLAADDGFWDAWMTERADVGASTSPCGTYHLCRCGTVITVERRAA